MKKLLLSALTCMFVAFTLTACSEKTENTSENRENVSETVPTADNPDDMEEERTVRYLDSLPEEMDFGGRSIRFVLSEGENGNITELSIWAEEDTGEVVDTAVFNRNLTVMERLNIQIEKPDVAQGDSNTSRVVHTSVKSGTPDADICGAYQYGGITLAADGLLFNLNNPDRFPYNDFEREYWGTDYMKAMSADGEKYFWSTGDLSLRYTGGMYVTYANATMFQNYYPEENLYAVVDEGSWTMDTLGSYASGVWVDVNADGKKDKKDKFGFVLQSIDPTDGMAAGCMVEFSSRNEEGFPVITINNEHTYAFWDKFYSLMFENEGSMLNPESDDSVSIMTNFGAGQYLMTCDKLFQSPIYLREMEDDFLILPMPKLNEEQPHYNTRIHDSCTIFGAPLCVSDTDCISAVLEAMASEACQVVTPAYYEIALKVK